MGIIGRFDRRREKASLQLVKKSTKHRVKKMTQNVTSLSNYRTLPSSSRQRPNETHESTIDVVSDSKHLVPGNSNSGSGTAINVDVATAAIIQKEVIDLLLSNSDQTCTTLEMANALAQNQSCLESHSKINKEASNRKYSDYSRMLGGGFPGKVVIKRLRKLNFFSRKSDKESMKSRYQWVNALNRLEKFPSSRDQTISTWDEAREILEQVISFPSSSSSWEGSHQDQGPKSSPNQLLSSVGKSSIESLETEIEILRGGVKASSASKKWKQVASYPILKVSKQNEGYGDEENLDILKLQESMAKADLCFNARIRTEEELLAKFQKNEAVQELEERRIAIEARKRASSLMRALNEDEREIVETAIHGLGHGGEIIAQAGADSVQRASMQTLKPGMWLNDEIIHYFYLMLAKRDEELCKNDPERKRSHFFKSFFITKLLNEGNASCDGKYEYRNVKRWSKKVPGKDIFNLDKILFPINMGNMHWICAAIFMKEKRIQIYDSMGSNGNRYLDALFNYVQDEHMDKKKTPLPDVDSWQLVPTQGDTPRQTNGKLFLFLDIFNIFFLTLTEFSHLQSAVKGYDCGVFTCMFADFLSKDTALVFNQEHINQCRERIALSIMKGAAIM